MNADPTILVAVLGLLASVISASVTYYLTKRQQFALEERRLKEEFYRRFIKALNDATAENPEDDAINALSEGFNSLVLVANKKVVKQLMDFHDFVKITNKDVSRGTKEWGQNFDKLYTELIRSIRADLFGREEDAATFPPLHMVGVASKKHTER
jgi:hypothetical protein